MVRTPRFHCRETGQRTKILQASQQGKRRKKKDILLGWYVLLLKRNDCKQAWREVSSHGYRVLVTTSPWNKVKMPWYQRSRVNLIKTITLSSKESKRNISEIFCEILNGNFQRKCFLCNHDLYHILL